ncbi:MAG: 3-isopropylmalate dehydratase small subunit [Clostridiales Family XIII bacterium]|jgi:3-isopropylmalate/(R)-2-methylmalate dehydratase small subunit|nr:3-isopropylmalate dehydratase small subunit [Clostridiales Family XIII bacterium]
MGKAFKYGDNVDTDVIIPARYLVTSDPEELAVHCMEDIDKNFAGDVRPGDIIVAGKNFGCGSSREHAPLAIKGAKVACVIAPTFARIFYRNSFNTGMPILESEEAAAKIDAGDEVEVDFATGLIRNITKSEVYQAEPFPPFISKLIESGGLAEYVKAQNGGGQ